MKFIEKFSNSIRHILSGSDSAEGFFRHYMSSFLLIVVVFFLILVSKFHTQAIYRKKLEADKRLQSIEAIYNNSNEKFKNSTLNSHIINEVKRRNLELEQSDLPPIMID